MSVQMDALMVQDPFPGGPALRRPDPVAGFQVRPARIGPVAEFHEQIVVIIGLGRLGPAERERKAAVWSDSPSRTPINWMSPAPPSSSAGCQAEPLGPGARNSTKDHDGVEPLGSR